MVRLAAVKSPSLAAKLNSAVTLDLPRLANISGVFLNHASDSKPALLSYTASSKKAAIVSAAFLLFSVFGSHAGRDEQRKNVEAELKFALSDEHGFPNNFIDHEFDCSDKIYAVTELSELQQGKRQIEFRWIDPSGKTRERTQYDFFPDEESNAKLWAWLELSPAKGAILVRWLNPAAGLEEFIGEWSLELYVDKKRVQTDEFQVAC